MPTKSRDPGQVAVIGAGIIGLSLAWSLARAGIAVTVFERGAPGRAASWAAAGMLAAGTEGGGEGDMARLCTRALALWPEFAAELEMASGIAVELRRCGLLHVAFDSQKEALRHSYESRRAAGEPVTWLAGPILHHHATGLDSSLVAGVLGPDESAVDNRRVTEALAIAAARAGAEIVTHADITTIEPGPGGGFTFRCGTQSRTADTVVIAAGGWSGELRGLPDWAAPVRPVRGQAYALGIADVSLTRLLPNIILGPGAYLVPKPDGTILVGASVEPERRDPILDPNVELALHEAACRMVPSLEALRVTERWVGFRPGTPDGLPILGAAEPEGLVIATGHYRNGILLAPLTAKLLTDSLVSGRQDADLALCSPLRFKGQSAQAGGMR